MCLCVNSKLMVYISESVEQDAARLLEECISRSPSSLLKNKVVTRSKSKGFCEDKDNTDMLENVDCVSQVTGVKDHVSNITQEKKDASHISEVRQDICSDLKPKEDDVKITEDKVPD